MDVSVVIPSYNSGITIRKCLDSIFSQKTRLKYEVIVVDSSTDNSPEILREYRVKMIRKAGQVFPGIARNIGIRAAKAPIIACIDADCIASPDWLDNLYKAHNKHSVVGGRILNGNPWNYFGWGLYFAEFSQYFSVAGKPIGQIPACNASYKKSVFDKIEFPGTQSAEDILLSRQLKNIWYDGTVVVKHINRPGLYSNLQRAIILGKGDAILKKDTVFEKFIFLFPALLLWRFAKIAGRSFLSPYWLAFILASPFVFLVLVAWYLGFVKEARNINI
ncbi:MAG: glycosyltransferase family 2 protein [Candidatus Woesearchaeota archaeon]